MAADNFLWFPKPAEGGLLTGKSSQPEGETTDKWFASKKALEIMSVNFSFQHATTIGSATGGAGAGKARFEGFSIEKGVDLASVPLFNACCAGAHFPSVMLAIRKVGGSPLVYVQYCFTTVFVTKIDWSGGGGEEAPKENVTFVFGGMGIQYIQQKSDGQEGTKMQGLWNQITNEPKLDPPPEFMPGSQG